VPRDAGWPLDPSSWVAPAATREALAAVLVSALDNDQLLLESLPIEVPSPHKLEALSYILIHFLSSLTDGIISYQIWIKLTAALPNLTTAASDPDIKSKILDVLSSAPNHNVAFVFLTSTLSKVAAELTPVAASSKTPPQRRLSFRRPAGAAAAEAEAAKRRRAKDHRFAEIVAPAVCRTGSSKKDKATRDKERAVLEICLQRDEDS
jgi:phosphatidylinositol-bisphosphatase